MIINRNLHAINLSNILKFKNWDIGKSAERVSSGLRINRAGDDAAGLAVSEKMTGQIHGLRQAERNTEDGISIVNTAEEYLRQSTDIMSRMRSLAVQAANGTYTPADRQLIQVEISALVDEIDRVASQADFNTMKIMLGDFSRHNPHASMWFHVGPNSFQKERIYIGTMTARGLGIRNDSGALAASLSSPEAANDAIGLLDHAIQRIVKQRSDLGAYISRFEKTAQELSQAWESAHGASSVVRDADVAEVMVALTKDTIIAETNMAMLAQANVQPNSVIALLREKLPF
ncbi:MAG TPA: flagellin [Spirochaetota bacterium]|nr:flagellin [Spirochaetota bacterium]HNT12141.1 flagellin [Spirochaetota bacterium]HNV47677.1 flagellin [Spirochaetota bacterium]HOS39492.1 flagellin [Spirochaetota bacterium]HPU88672.1 flagellin [Spirochaetota bacterium]